MLHLNFGWIFIFQEGCYQIANSDFLRCLQINWETNKNIFEAFSAITKINYYVNQ